MASPLLVLSDVHLSRHYGDKPGQDLAELISQHPNCEIVLAGDIFDLTLDSAEVPSEESMISALTPHRDLERILGSHIKKGGRLSLVPGNHDGNLGHRDAVTHLRKYLGAENDATIQIYPWFLRRGDLHIEHGHLYDPDCAPNHPLADPNPRHEGLGNALMRRFVAPNEAYFFSHQNQTTMSSGVATAFKKWGARAPWVIARYFGTAFSLWAEATLMKNTVHLEKELGESRLQSYADRHQIPVEALWNLLSSTPLPTHHSARDVFYRLYFDRILAAGSILLGAGVLSTAGLGMALGTLPIVSASGTLTSGGALLSAVGAGYLFSNVKKNKNRYGHAVIKQLSSGARLIRDATEARLVVLGHSHVEVDEPGYLNLGSFGYSSRGRPYLLIDENGHHERRYFRSS